MSRQLIFVTVPPSWEQNILREIFAFSFLKQHILLEILALSLSNAKYFLKNSCSPSRRQNILFEMSAFSPVEGKIFFLKYSLSVFGKQNIFFLKYPRSPRQQGLPTACATSKGDGSWSRGGQGGQSQGDHDDADEDDGHLVGDDYWGGQGGQSQGADSALNDDADQLWKSTFIFLGNCSWWWAKGSTSSEG